MKRLLYISLFCLVQAAIGMDALWIDEEDQVSISSFTQAIHQRYYCIARLEQVHNLIEQLRCACQITYQDFQSLSQIQPQHPRIIECIEAMQKDASSGPLIELWHQVSTYKYITDEQFMQEYTALVCIVAHHLVSLNHEQLSIEDQKTLSSFITKGFKNGTGEIGSHEITYRYYLKRRLKKVSTLLKQCAQVPCEYAVYIHLPHCSDERIVGCAQEIESEKSFMPLIALIKDFEQFQSVEDTQFVHELLSLILVIEQHVLAPLYLPRQRELCAHYEHDIEGLTIEELLRSIDILTSHIEPCARTENQFDNSLLPVTTVAAVACGSLALWYAVHSKGAMW